MCWLVVGPHADDVEFGAGGIIARLIRTGEVARDDIHMVVVSTSDVTRMNGNPALAKVRMEETGKASQVLGLGTDPVFMGWEQNNLINEHRGELVAHFDKLLDTFKPKNVLMPMPGFHQDHTAVHDAMVAAMRPTHKQPVDRVLLYEYPGDCWKPLRMSVPDTGWQYFRLTKEDMAKKLKALMCHSSQGMTDDNAHVSLRGVNALATLRGSEVGADYAERFYLLRGVS